MARRPHSYVWGRFLPRRAERNQGQAAQARLGQHEQRLSGFLSLLAGSLGLSWALADSRGLSRTSRYNIPSLTHVFGGKTAFCPGRGRSALSRSGGGQECPPSRRTVAWRRTQERLRIPQPKDWRARPNT